MFDFIKGIFQFVADIIVGIGRSVASLSGSIAYGNVTYNGAIGLNGTGLTTFLRKPILSGELINISVTFEELLLYVIPIVLVILFIIFICKFIFKLIGMVKIW